MTSTRTGGTTRATRSRRRGSSSARSSAPSPRARRSPRAPAPTARGCAHSTRASRRCIARVPPPERKLVTDHDALGYFAARYGLAVVGAVFPAQSTQAQASAGDVAALERLIRAEHVRAVFPDAALNARLSRRIASDTGASASGRALRRRARPARLGRRDASPRCWQTNAARSSAGSAADASGARRDEPWAPVPRARRPRCSRPTRSRRPTRARACRRSASVTFAVARRPRIAVLGPNGGGKSTLFRVLSGELAPDPRDAAAARRRRRARAADRALAPRLPRQRARRGADGRAAAPSLVPAARPPRARASAARRSNGSGSRTRRSATFGDLSGGQRQRVLVARALVAGRAGAAARRALQRPRRRRAPRSSSA